MTFQACCTVLDIKTVEPKSDKGKRKQIMRVTEPSLFGRQGELSTLDVTVYDGQSKILDNIGPGCRVFVMGKVSGWLNDKGYVNPTLSADRIELLAGVGSPPYRHPESQRTPSAPAYVKPVAEALPVPPADDPCLLF